ncbi:MAG: recombination protein O N-terminal domain-containing protein [Treponema sp.]|jgi:DNA repair protein RecO (recombination protein O)|nr:recombination protein O N-terminal domain-containing protein [Treponema sp.]
MLRSFSCEALVLKTSPSGESNREAWFLCADQGILRATVFGGPKSRLRSHVSPFHSGTLWVYRDPVRDSCKVSDFDVRSWRPGLRELYERTMAADAVADTVLASHGGGGGWDRALSLAGAGLDALAEAGAEASGRVFVHFLWNWAAFLGLRPDLAEADRPYTGPCEALPDGLVWFDRLEGAFTRTAPAGSGNRFLPLAPGARRWLLAVQDLAPERMLRISADPLSLAQARTVVTALMAEIIGRELPTWNF